MAADLTALERLTQALWAYERAAALARALRIRPAYDLEDERWLCLAFRAQVCGYPATAASEGCLEWARQAVSDFARQRPAAHAQALREAA